MQQAFLPRQKERVEARTAAREETHSFKNSVETVEELLPKVERLANKLNEVASGYKEERIMEKINSQLEEMQKTWTDMKPAINKLKNDPELMAYAE